MNCRRARKLVYELVDGAADETVRAELEHHLAGCAECETLAGQLERSMELLRRAPVETLDENFNWKVRLAIHKERNAIRESMASQGAVFRSWNLRYAASAAAAFVVAVALGWYSLGSGLISVDRGGSVVAQQAAGNAEAPPSNITPLPQSPFLNMSPASPVSEGIHGPFRHTSTRTGAITAGPEAIDLDSLVRVQTNGMTEEERIEYLQRRAEFIDQYLQQCRERARR